MLTEQNKSEIYEVLSSKFEKDIPYAISEIGRELTLSGNGCRKFSYARMKDMLQDMPDFIAFLPEDSADAGKVKLLEWGGPMKHLRRHMDEYASTTSDLLEAQNELGGGVLIKNSGRPDKKEFTEEIKKQVYDLLCSRFSKGNAIHMAAISKYLIANGYTPRSYGFSKMKNMLSTMPRYLSMQDVIINQVPNVLITILENDQTEDAAAASETESSASDVSGATLQTQPALRHASSQRNVSPVRSSSGSVRFSGNATGSTFKAEPSPQTVKAEKKPSRQSHGDNTSTFDRLVYMPPKVVDFLTRKGMRDPLDILSRAYQKSVDARTYEQRADAITFPVEWEHSPENMIAILKKNERPYGKQWYLTYVGFPKQEREAEAQASDDPDTETVSDPLGALESFADIGYWQEFLRELSSEALPERWDTSNRRLGRYYILKKYIQLTFYKLQQENKVLISEDGRMAAFNTGLLSVHYDDIYACFTPSKSTAGPDWRFEGFISLGSRGKEQLLKDFTSSFTVLPEAPCYTARPQDLFFDPQAKVDVAYERLLMDDLRRLPLGYLKESAFGDDGAGEMIEAIEEAASETGRRQAYFALSRYLASNDRIFRRLKSRLEDAVYMGLKRTRRNLRDAVPIYSLKTDSICQVIPLCLEEDSVTDAVLVLCSNEKGEYQAQMILQPDSAYLYARLLGRTEPDYAPFGGRGGTYAAAVNGANASSSAASGGSNTAPGMK